MIMLWFTPEMWQQMNRVQSGYWALLSSGGCLSLNVKDQLTPFALEHSSEVWPLSSLQGGAGEGATLELWKTSADQIGKISNEKYCCSRLHPLGGVTRSNWRAAVVLLRPTQDFLTGCHQALAQARRGWINNQYLSIHQGIACQQVTSISLLFTTFAVAQVWTNPHP